ncbi:MAG TPA: hypothetical protein VFF81_03075 [Noviherbaspirillum sp.]|nr:hypothetical protein [Noviherbaspirillum sp.]
MEFSLPIKILGILLLANACYATYAHRKERLTIYVDWTDAAITGLTPLIGFAVFLLLSFLNVPEEVGKTIAQLCVLVLVGFGIRMSWRANASTGAFLSSVVAKYTVLFAFYVLLWAIYSGGERRRKYERRSTAEKRHAAAVAATVAAYVTWSLWVCRFAEFSPVADWFSGESAGSFAVENGDEAEESEEIEEAEQAEQTEEMNDAVRPAPIASTEVVPPGSPYIGQTFNVVFQGLQPGLAHAEVRMKLAKLFNASPEQVDRLISMQSYVIKKCVKPEVAAKYKAAIESAGGICELQSVASSEEFATQLSRAA